MGTKFEPINMDYAKTVLKSSDDFTWVPSPNNEVLRSQLEREKPESGWATSLVRYPKGAQFKSHSHPGGEQFFVLEGTFSDERGDYHENTYVQNPVGSLHAPYSEDGCLIFVRLGAVSKEAGLIVEPFYDSKEIVRIKTGPEDWLEVRTISKGESHMASGVEVLILGGQVSINSKLYKRHSWARVSKSDSINLQATENSKILFRPLLRT